MSMLTGEARQTMPQTLAEALYFIADKVSYDAAAWVGSGYILGPDKAADFDLLIYVEDKVAAEVAAFAAGFIPGGSADPQAMQDCWQSMRLGSINLLICDDLTFFNSWRIAAEACKYLGLEDKERRVNVHRIIMDGWTADRCKVAL